MVLIPTGEKEKILAFSNKLDKPSFTSIANGLNNKDQILPKLLYGSKRFKSKILPVNNESTTSVSNPKRV